MIVTFDEVAVDHDSLALLPLVMLRGRDSDLFSAKACGGIYSGTCLGKGESVDPV